MEAKKEKEREAERQKKEKREAKNVGKQIVAQIPRGKKNKIKKMKEKYADQDDDEREMRLALLGAKDVKDFDIKKHADRKGEFNS